MRAEPAGEQQGVKGGAGVLYQGGVLVGLSPWEEHSVQGGMASVCLPLSLTSIQRKACLQPRARLLRETASARRGWGNGCGRWTGEVWPLSS